MRIIENKPVMYRKSLFTYIVADGDDLIFYNSMEGTRSIKRCSSTYRDEIERYLNKKTFEDCDNSVFKALLDNKYIVPDEADESMLLENMFSLRGGNLLQLIILPTEKCNFRCKYCYESFSKGDMDDSLTEAIVTYVSKHIVHYTGLRVSWFGGEPTLRMDTICKLSDKFIEICKRTKRTYSANLTSNGYLLNLESFNALCKAHVYEYQITIDGMKWMHDSQRVLADGKGSFDKILNNLCEIKNEAKSRRWRIILRTNFSKQIFENVDQYVNYFFDLFGDDDRFTFLFRPAGDWGGERVKNYKDNLLQGDSLSELIRKLRSLDKMLNIDKHLDFLEPGGSMCIASGRNTILIDSQGIIRKCTCALDDTRNIVGNICENGIVNIDKYRMAEWHFYKLEKKCEKCAFLPCCMNNACPADYTLLRGNTNICHVYEKNSLEEILRYINKQGKVRGLFDERNIT